MDIVIRFNFEKKEEWIDFAYKLQTEKELMKCNILTKNLLKRRKSLANEIKRWYKEGISCLTVALFLSTGSEETLSKINDWIKENHYESNYELCNVMGELHMSLDELLDRNNENPKRINAMRIIHMSFDEYLDWNKKNRNGISEN